MTMLNFASIADEALATEPIGCTHDDAMLDDGTDCEHAAHWKAFDAATFEYSCDDCRYAWNPNYGWETVEVCYACGKEDYELWQAGL